MKRIFWVIILSALTLANIYMTRQQAAALSNLSQLRTEKEQLAGEIAGLEERIAELQTSHELYISVSENINSRLAVVEGRAGP